MEGKNKVFSIVLLIIVALLALSLVVLVGIVFLGNSNNSNEANNVTVSETVRVPSDEDLSSRILYGTEPVLLNLKNENKQSPTPPVIKLNIELLYYKEIKDMDVELKLNTYDKRIKELVNTYFQKMTLEEAMNPDTKTKARTDLIKSVNELLNENEGAKRPIIYNIVFDEWFYT